MLCVCVRMRAFFSDKMAAVAMYSVDVCWRAVDIVDIFGRDCCSDIQMLNSVV